MKLFLFLCLSLCGASVMAAPLVAEAPIMGVGSGTTVSVSTYAWTELPTTSTLSSRSGIKISNPSTNTGNVVCILATTTPTEATTVRPIEIQPGENPFIPCRIDIELYCISLHTAAENVHVQEVRQ